MKGFLRCSVFLLSVLITLSLGCDKRNPLKPLNPVEGKLTLTGEQLPLPGSTDFTFRQTASWNENTEQGTLFAWRICTTDSILPNGMVTDADGWIYHYAAGADTQIPLSQPGTHRTIWTSTKSQSWEFNSQNQRLARIISKVDVKIKSADTISEVYTLPYRDDRIIASRIIAPFSYGATTGMGIHFRFQEHIQNIYVEGMYAHHFMYRLNIIDSGLNVLTHGEWYSTIDCENIRELLLTGNTTPALVANAADQFTQLEIYVVSRQGVEEDTHQTTHFAVATGFHPETLIYEQTLLALGQYHYALYQDWHQTPFPGLEYSETGYYPTALFNDNGANTVINSTDFRIQLTWGWHGQFALLQPNNNIIVTDDPTDQLCNFTMDETSDVVYFASIDYFDLRLDNQPFPADGYFSNHQVVQHSDGTSWLRIPNTGLTSQNVILNNLASGTHTFAVSAVDSQGIYDPTPVTYTFRLDNYIFPALRSGILIVDDDLNNNAFCPDATVDQIYQNMIPTTYGEVVQFDRSQSQYHDLWNRKIASTQLQHYKAIVYHDDYTIQTMNLPIDADAYSIYLANGGNMIISGGCNLYVCFQYLNLIPALAMQISGETGIENYHYLSSSMINTPYFVSALSDVPLYPDVNLETETSFNNLINTRNGLGSVTYFDDMPQNEMLYLFGCKLPGTDNYSPTQEMYDQLNNKPMGFRHSNGSGRVAVFGFPLSYMQQVPMQTAMQQILWDVIYPSGTKGR